MRGVGGLITPSFYFHKHIPSEPRETHITVDVDANWKKEKSQILSEYSQMAKQMLKLKSLKRNRETSLDAHSGCNQNISEKQFISTSIHHTEKIDLVNTMLISILYIVFHDLLFNIDGKLRCECNFSGETM